MFVRGTGLEYSSPATDPAKLGVANYEATPPETEQSASATDTEEEDIESETESVEQEEPLLTALFKALLACFRKVT